jgi:hypothetical protein
MRTFELQRDVDVTGISGTGVVAQGVEFDDGTVVVRWLKRQDVIEPTTVIHPTMDNVLALHAHGGSSQVVWT